MIRTFCDKCGTEIDIKNKCSGGMNDDSKLGANFGFSPQPSNLRTIVRFNFTIDIVKEGNTKFDLCKYCVIEEVKKLDDRPTMLPP